MKKCLVIAPNKPLSADSPSTSQSPEELTLELTYPNLQEQDGVRRATAHARLVFKPADMDTDTGEPEVSSAESWRFVAGNHNPALADTDTPGLDYMMAAEIRLLLERLDGPK